MSHSIIKASGRNGRLSLGCMVTIISALINSLVSWKWITNFADRVLFEGSDRVAFSALSSLEWTPELAFKFQNCPVLEHGWQ